MPSYRICLQQYNNNNNNNIRFFLVASHTRGSQKAIENEQKEEVQVSSLAKILLGGGRSKVDGSVSVREVGGCI